MGRSRAVPNPADDDAYQRSKRRRAASSGENFETMATVPGTSDGKKVLYHCNYCNKDISGKIRMKCTKCADFDLCLECFSVGAEVAPHKSNHPYRVMDSLSFPLICPDWNADEEILLLEGMEMYGLGNWAEIAEHVGTKNKAQCIDHYMTAYLNSPCYPLPDMSHVNGKNRKDLLAMAKVEDECKKGISVFGNITQKAECLFSPSRVKLENLNREAPAGRSSSILTAASGANKKASNMGQFNTDNDGTKVEDLTSSQDPCMDRSVGVKKPKYSGDQGPSMAELSGYNPWRHEFDPEYDDDAEQALAEMEFKESDSETERELKLRVLHIYLSRLNERKRRKDFILERNLLYPKPLEKELSSEDREIYQRYKVFMCFQSQEEHEALVQSALEERRIRRRIQELQECRAAGCRTLAEAKIYSEQKRKRDSEASAQQGKEGSQVVVSKASAKANRGMNREKGGCDGIVQNTLDNHKMKGGSGLETSDEDTTSIITGQTTTRSLDDWDITGLPAADLLSKAEQQLCCQNRLLPSHYLQIQEVLTREILKGTIVERSDAHGFFEVDPSKVDLIFDIVNKKEISAASNLPQKEIGKYIKILGEALKLSQPINSNSISVHMPRFCTLLQLNKSAQELAAHIGEVVINKCFCTRRNPISISAAAIYLACQLEDKRKTQAEICKVTGLTEVTLRKVYKELLENWDDLLPPNYTPAVPPEKAFPMTTITSGRSLTKVDTEVSHQEKDKHPEIRKTSCRGVVVMETDHQSKSDSRGRSVVSLETMDLNQEAAFLQPQAPSGMTASKPSREKKEPKGDQGMDIDEVKPTAFDCALKDSKNSGTSVRWTGQVPTSSNRWPFRPPSVVPGSSSYDRSGKQKASSFASRIQGTGNQKEGDDND